MGLSQVSDALAQLTAEEMDTLSRQLLVSMRRGEFAPTSEVDLFVTQTCNLRCDYCFVRGMQSVTSDEEHLRRAVDFALADSRALGRLKLVLFGGEPLLQKKLMRGVAGHAVMRGRELGKEVWFECTTNGTLLDEEAMRLAREYGFCYLVSVDGGRETHDLHRRTPTGAGSFDRVIEKIPLLHRWNHHDARARVTVSPETVHNLCPGVQELRELGFSYFQIAPVEDGEWSREELNEYERQMRDVARWFLESNGNGRPTRVTNFEESLDELKGRTAGNWGCHAGRGRLAIDCTGGVWPCAKFAGLDGGQGRCQLGTLDGGITEWDTRRLVTNSDAQTRYHCASCSFREVCTGGCLASNLSVTGSMFSPNPAYCGTVQAIVRILTDMPELTRV